MKNFELYLILAGIVPAFLACKVEEEALSGKERVLMTFTTGAEDNAGTRTTIDGTDVLWTEGDRISIFDGSGNNCFSLISGAGTNTAEFSGYAVPDEEYTAVYPYSEDTECENGIVTSVLPTTQYSTTDGSFDTMLNPSVAKTSGNILYFKNVAGIIQVNVKGLGDGTDVQSIEIRADKSLAGKFSADTGDDEYTAVSAPGTSGNLGVTLEGKDGGKMAEGPYHIVVLPGNYSYLTVTAILSDNSHIRKSFENVEIMAGGGASLQMDASEAVPGLPERDPYQDFLDQNENNMLLDFSYAGYNHGESAPEEIIITENADGTCSSSNGYSVYNIEDYGADGSDGLSDREAFLNMLEDIFGTPEKKGNPKTQITFPSKNSAKAVLYFPEGNFILHTEDDDSVTTDGSRLSFTILVRSGDIIMKGAGKDLTTITMDGKNYPDDPDVLYSSPDMIQFKHNTGIQPGAVLATVTGDSSKGEFSVTVSGTGQIQAGDLVCLYLKNNSQDVVASELEPYEADQSWVMAGDYGVSVQDLHRVRSVSGNTVTFHEPLMHSIDADWNWTIVRYQHYENVGIEDLTFAGHAKEGFIHHASWEDDGAYKPVSMTRVANSWIRRVRFDNVSEACSIISSANVSVYDVAIEGNRGHAAIRSQGSSRVFIGACTDYTCGLDLAESGKEISGGSTVQTGQYHTFGVSKESIGAVLWRNEWGSDANFECHATQPRATLIDCCKGGWNMLRAGGDSNQMPNHLDDLTIWNFNATNNSHAGTWIWWDYNSRYWKFLPPVIVGFHGADTEFDQTQVKADISHGTPVTPESLYEAQLQRRLGYLPAWLQALK